MSHLNSGDPLLKTLHIFPEDSFVICHRIGFLMLSAFHSTFQKISESLSQI